MLKRKVSDEEGNAGATGKRRSDAGATGYHELGKQQDQLNMKMMTLAVHFYKKPEIAEYRAWVICSSGENGIAFSRKLILS